MEEKQRKLDAAKVQSCSTVSDVFCGPCVLCVPFALCMDVYGERWHPRWYDCPETRGVELAGCVVYSMLVPLGLIGSLNVYVKHASFIRQMTDIDDM